MGVTERIWAAFTAVVKLEDKVNRHSEAMRDHQAKIEVLTERIIRIEAQLEMLTSAALVKKLKGPTSKSQ